MKKMLSLALAVILAACGCVYVGVSAIDKAIGVTDEMCSPDFWKERTFIGSDKLLMTDEQIVALNRVGIDADGTHLIDIENVPALDAYSLSQRLTPAPPDGKTLYLNGEKLNTDEYFGKLTEAVRTTGYTETSMEPKKAVTVHCTNLRSIPSDDVLGYSATDTDDELLSESLTVNEPFIIRAKCSYDGKTYYYGASLNCNGWINGDDLAICSSKEEWLDAWKCEPGKEDFIVVTTEKIILDKNIYSANSSELKLRLGTALKLVPEDKIPLKVGDRGTWNNYVVYIPVRNDDGTYSKEMALIPQHCKVNVGYPDFTQGNLLDIAFECLGTTYGWAGMLDSSDCSQYICMVYRCFGLSIPRNTNWQQLVPGTLYNLTGVSDELKQQFIRTMPAGTILFISGHEMMYLGDENGTGYVISNLGTVVESGGSDSIRTIHSTCITPLTVRRSSQYNYATWLTSITSAVCFVPQQEISQCEISASAGCSDTEFADYDLTVSLNGNELYKGVNYTVEQSADKLTVKGFGFWTGEKEITIESLHTDSDGNDICDDCGDFISGCFFSHLVFCIRRFLEKPAGLLCCICKCICK